MAGPGERHSDNDGSDIFWPGYVDAVTNLVLNLLFLLTIMIVAVFMFALELGRASMGGPAKQPAVTAKSTPDSAAKGATDSGTGKRPTIALPGAGLGRNAASELSPAQSAELAKENSALKREVQRLNMQLARQVSPNVSPGSVQQKTVDVASTLPAPKKSLDRAVAASDTDILIRFSDEAIAFSPAERERVREVLKPVVARGGKTGISVEVPAGFTEAKRMGYYRAMAVRNLLIEMNMPKEHIDVSVREGNTGANASQVRVKSR